MTLRRSDLDQAARYLRYACELLEREAFGKTAPLRKLLDLAVRRLSPGDNYVGDAAAEITPVSSAAELFCGEGDDARWSVLAFRGPWSVECRIG